MATFPTNVFTVTNTSTTSGPVYVNSTGTYINTLTTGGYGGSPWYTNTIAHSPYVNPLEFAGQVFRDKVDALRDKYPSLGLSYDMDL